MSDEHIPTLTHATERDIDLLLVEELVASPGFVHWIASNCHFGEPVAESRVLHSKRRTASRREIDIFVDLRHCDGTRSALLIENKLDAAEQPDQAESYREELTILDGDFARSAMVIVCPEGYAASNPTFTGKFDALVTYESIGDYFDTAARSASDEIIARLLFRRDLIDQAVNKRRRGYVPVLNETVGDFNGRYVALLAEFAPGIVPGPSMLKAANPDESTSMIFDHAASMSGLASNIPISRFAHELGRGRAHRANYVSVVFKGWGAALPRVQDRLEADAAELGARFEAKLPTKNRPNPGLVMWCPTEPVDNQGDFDAQREAIVAGMRKALDLRHWLFVNRATLENWQRMIGS